VRGLVARGAGRPEDAIPLLDEAERVATQAVHPLTAGIARTLRGYSRIDAGDPAGAERDARSTLELLRPLDVEEAVRVDPTVLLAQARLDQGDLEAALGLLAGVAEGGSAALVFHRRQALAHYAAALLAAGKVADALDWARRAQQVPAEDVRSQVVGKRVLAGALAAAGEREAAALAAKDAVQLAYATEQTAERRASDEVFRTVVADGP
jgi:ATP/maltotriose-dependent transcriptional regulator MalT